MACKVIRNDEGTIVSVLAPNGNQSILFNNILNDIKDSEEALLEYSTTYTDGFKSILDSTFTNIDQQELYDQNGEVKFEIYNKIMNPELTLLNNVEFEAYPPDLFYRIPDEQVNFSLKVVNALVDLSSLKETKRTRKYGEQAEPERLTIRLNTKEKPYLEDNLRKVLQGKDVTNQQIDFVFDYMKSNNIQEISTSELAAAIAGSYSYTIEINTANQYFSNRKIKFEEKYKSLPYTVYDTYTNMPLKSFKTKEEAEKYIQSPTKFYSNLTVPGGTNYTENEIATLAIIPSIKGHAQFATDKGIGWFRSDDSVKNAKIIPSDLTEDEILDMQILNEDAYRQERLGKQVGGEITKTRRILEVQSDLFQKGRSKKYLTKNRIEEGEAINFYGDEDLTGQANDAIYVEKSQSDIYWEWIELSGSIYEPYSKESIKEYEDYKSGKPIKSLEYKNQFLQLLNKDNNWVTFFVKSIIQDSAKRGYEKVLFPTGDTASKVEGHTTLEEFKKQKEGRLKYLETKKNNIKVIEPSREKIYYQVIVEGEQYSPGETVESLPEVLEEINNEIDNEINQLKQELERVEREGFGALKPIYNFYENTVANILKKRGYTPKKITDEYSNTWNEITIKLDRDLQSIEFNKESEDFVAENEIAFATVKKIADSFSKRFGIAYNIIDESEARKMLNEAGFEYDNEPAFFFNGEVYITTGNFNPKNIIHEFSHPFIKAIAKNNSALFNKLYNELSKTEEGKAIIKYVEEKYKDKNVEGRKEEVLVRALTQQALNKSTFTESTPAFTKIINKILYHIKQFMRKVFGKIKIESLNVDTTLEELSEMLTTESLNLSIKDAIGNGVEFNRETGREAANYLKKTERIKLEQGINTFFDLLKKNSSIIRDGLTQDNDLYEVFVDSELEKGRIFSDTIRSLSKYTTLDSTDPAAIDDALKFRELQITAFINSLVEYEDAVDRIGEEISRIRSSTDPNEFAITRLDYLKRILKTTLQTTDQIKKDMVEQNVPVNSPVFKLVNELEDKSKIGVNSIYNYFEKVLPPILAPQLEGTNKMIIKQYDQKIDDLRKKGANAEIINKLEKEKQSYLRDENYLARAIIGTEPEPALLGISAFVESAISSPDGLISSFAKMVKATMIDVDLNAKKNADEFFDAVNPLIEEANVNFNTISEAGNKMTTVQEKGYTDPTTGEYTTRKVVEFLNPFKDHQLVLSKFSFEIREAIKEKDSDKLVQIKKRKKMFYRQYMHNEFLPIVYTADDIFERTYLDSTGVVHEVGRIAKERRDKILEFIAAENSIIRDELEKLEISSRMKSDSLWSDYYALYSKYTPDGKLKDEVELAITNVLLENRKKRMEFYAWESDEVVDSMPIKRFEKARKLFKERLQTKYAEDSKEYKEKLAEWDRVNTRTVIDKKFYADRQIILDEIKDIYNQIAATKLLSKEDEEEILKSQNKMQKNMEEILDQMYGYRDEENHPNGLLISEEKVARLKVIQEEINILREALRNGEGLSKTEKLEMQKLLDKEDEEGLTDEESKRLDFLDTQNVFSNVPKALKKKLATKFKELNEIQGKYSTKYYMIAYNYQLERVNERLRAAGASDRKLIKLLDSLNVDELGLDQGFLNKAFKDKAFKTWFEKNHVLAIVFDSVSERYEQKYQRLPIWNEIRPQNEAKYLRKMVLSDGETIYGLPTLNYYRQNVKPEYITPEIDENGLPTRDVNGRFLPRFIPNSPYINQEYFDLKTKDEKLFDLLNKITEMHLKFQQKDDEGGRLGYEVPRFERSSKELTETTAFLSGKVSGAKAVVKNIINKFRSNPEDFDEGLSTEDKFTLISLDQFDDDDGKIHIAGKAYLDDDQVSRDVITSVLRHMWGIERFSELKKIHPVAKALNDTLQNPKNFPVDNKKGMGNLIDKASRVFTRGKTEGSRAKAVKGLVEKNFYNIQQTGLGSDTVFLQKLSRYMMAGASFGFFALDVVSALKNRFGQQIQQTVELAAGTSYDAKSFLKGKITASKAMMEITGSIYSRGKLPLLAQMVDIFDPVQGRFYEKFAERMTRTVFKDAARPLNATMSPRKFLELEVGLEFFFGVMEFTKVERTIGATTELIPYTEAFELVDGKIKLRSGIDPKYDIGGSEFKRIRLFIQEKQNILNGVYAMFDQPEGARYLFYRMYLFLRKFFVTGFMNRFGFSGSIFKPRYRRNEATENLEMGYWINTLDAIIQMLRTGGRHMHYMLPQQRKATYKFLSELAILAIASMVIPWILGWDDDDDERYEKLRERQGGPLGSEDFKLGGWLANHMLYQAIAVSSENSQFYTVKFYSEMLGDFNLANGPTLEMYAKMLNNAYLWATDDPGAYYKKDVGPYPWQKAESAKILNNIGKAFALTGKNIDPAKAVQDMISIQTIK